MLGDRRLLIVDDGSAVRAPVDLESSAGREEGRRLGRGWSGVCRSRCRGRWWQCGLGVDLVSVEGHEGAFREDVGTCRRVIGRV